MTDPARGLFLRQCGTVTHRADVASTAPGDRWLARLAGVVSAGVALGVTELVGGTATPAQSLVGSVGGEIIDNAPAVVVRGAIDALGTSDKPVLLTLVVLVCLGLGAVVGTAARRRPWVGPVAFSAAGLLGMLAGFNDPLADDTVTVVATVLAVVAGSGTLALLLRLLPAPAPMTADTDADTDTAAAPAPIP
ncbi:MAG TPA: hypothetical protein VIY72_04165, partial [Acidimicrobiales bacterium]